MLGIGSPSTAMIFSARCISAVDGEQLHVDSVEHLLQHVFQYMVSPLWTRSCWQWLSDAIVGLCFHLD